MEGSISLPRSITERKWSRTPATMYLFIHLVIKANWKDGIWLGIPVRRGELITSVSTLSRDLRLKESQIRSAIKSLQDDGLIAIESTNRYTKIIVCDFDDYQFSKKTDKQTDAKPVSEIRMNGEKKVTDSSNADVIERLYALYPSRSECGDRGIRSTGKCAKDKQRLASLLKTHTPEQIERSISRYVEEQGGKYLKNFSTFLNNLPEYEEEAAPPPTREERARALGYQTWNE